VGIGVSSGTPIMTDVDFIGHTVNLAQRLSSIAKGSQILTTAAVQSGARLPDDLRYVALGDRSLKGIGREQVVEVAWLEEVVRISDARDRLTLILTERGTIVIEFAKDARKDAADALRNLLDIGIAERSASAFFQRAIARIAFQALRGAASRIEGTLERRADSVELALARRGLSLRIGSRTLVLPNVDPAAAKQFVESATRMRHVTSV
jgi:hypothetical protein